jgi:hypothetical protein
MEEISSTLKATSLSLHIGTIDVSMPKRQRGDERRSESDTTQQLPSLVIAALHNFVQQERKTNFSFLSQYSHYYKHQQELLVVSQADADDIHAVRRTAGRDTAAFYNDWYTFTEPLRSDGYARTIAIEIQPGNDIPITVDTLTIVEFGRANKIEREATFWIRDTYCTPNDDMWAMRFPDMQYDEQRLWWEGTGRVFRFLELPLEMREAIYLQVVGPVIIPDVVTQRDGTPKLVLGTGLSFGDPNRVGRNRDPDIQRPNMAIMRVSRRIQAEATQVANRDSIKRFTTLRTSDMYSTGPSTSPNLVWQKLRSVATPVGFLRKIQLEMSARDYLGFVGIWPVPTQPLRMAAPFPFDISTLAHLENLDTIDFRFISPEHKLAECPWIGPHSCQKKWIDLFFIHAWDALDALKVSKGVKYTLSGCIKNSGRDYWAGLLNDKSIDHTATIRTFKRQIRASVTGASLTCDCSNPCVGGPRLFKVQPYEVRLIEGIQAELDKAYWDFAD